MFKINIYIVLIFIILIIILLLLFMYNKIINIENFSVNDEVILTGSTIINYIDNNNKIDSKYIQFNSSGTIIFKYTSICDILLIGGGGGGSTGGGGAGQFLYLENILFMKDQTYNIIIGEGGKGNNPTTRGADGSNTYIHINNNKIYIAYGGGGGAPINTLANTLSNSIIGSGGGNGHDSGAIENPVKNLNTGNKGGRCGAYGSYNSGGGGGGAGGVGGNGIAGNGSLNGSGGKGGDGGIGILSNITGINKYYAGGGAGGTNINSNTNTASRPLGGQGGGGNGNLINNEDGYNGIENTGGGGGGCDWEGKKGGNGGSGVVIIRYKIPEASAREINLLSSISQLTTEDISTELIKYPSLIIDSFSEPSKINNNEYMQTFTTNGLPHKIIFSYYNDNKSINYPLKLFNGYTNYNERNYLVKNYTSTIINTYNIDTGNYYGNNIYNKYGVNENGEWISISFPQSFILKKYGFIAINGLENCAPGIWKLYGRNNDTENYSIIDENTLRLSNNDFKNSENLYLRKKYDNSISYNTYLFIFKSLASNNMNYEFGGKLNFTQILLFGLAPE